MDSPIVEELGNDAAALDTFRVVTEMAPAMLWMGDETGKCLFLNRAQRLFWGVKFSELATFHWGQTMHPDDVEAISGPFAKGMSKQIPFSCEGRYRRADGEWRWLRTEAQPRFSADQQFIGMIGVNTDVTDRRQAEARQHLLMEELNHRVKNSLASVISIARQTAKSAGDLDAFIGTFTDRMQAMAKTHDLLTARHWEGAELSEILRNELRPYGDQIRLEGAPVTLSPQRAVSMGLIVHELATNSAKYGALAKPGETLEVSWTVLDDMGSLEWRERSSSTVNDGREGFGTRLIHSLASNDLSGSAVLARNGDAFRALIGFRI